MSYYMGDYYRGGFFSSLWGGIKGLAGGLLGGGGGAAKPASTIIQNVMPGVGNLAQKVMTVAKRSSAGVAKVVSKHPVMTAAAAAGAVAGGASMAGHGGGRAAAAGGGGGGGRRRRVNVCNPRALRRAIRRTHGFAKLAMKTIHIVHPKRPARFGGFKKRRRK